MRTVLVIVIALVVLGLAYYFLIYKKGTGSSENIFNAIFMPKQYTGPRPETVVADRG